MKTNKIKRILIALDFDPSSQKVAVAGFNMAKEIGANVVLLHVKINLVNYSLTYKKLGSLRLESIEELELAAKNFLKNSKHNLEEHLIQTIVKEGNFAESIISSAKEMAIDTIVMGRVTNEVLQQTRIPLLIIPTGEFDKMNTFISLDN